MQTYALERNLADMFKTVLSGNQLKDAATADQLNKLYTMDVNRTKAALGNTRLNALGRLDEAFASALPQGADSSAWATIATAGGDFNPSQIANTISTLKDTGRVDDAVGLYEKNPDLANFYLRAGGKIPYTPYSVNEKGAVINEATGSIDTNNQLAQASLGKLLAEAAYNYAGANQRNFITPGNNSVVYIGDGKGQARTVINPSYNPNSGSGDGLTLNAQLDEVFLEPSLDQKGQPIVDPLTGRMAMAPNQQRKQAFLAWYDRNRHAFRSVNDALVKWVALEQEHQGSQGQQIENLRTELLPQAQQNATDALWFNGMAGGPSEQVINAEVQKLMEADPRYAGANSSTFVPQDMPPLGSEIAAQGQQATQSMNNAPGNRDQELIEQYKTAQWQANGKTFTMDDVIETARKHNMSVEAVMRRLGLLQ